VRVARNGLISLIALTTMAIVVVVAIGALLFAAIWFYPEI